MKKPLKKRAFSLVELLITIVIVGVLATISVSTYNEFISRAEIARDLANLSSKVSKLKVRRVEYQTGSVSAQEIMEEDLSVVAEAIYIARKKEKINLIDITGYHCSDCVCRDENFSEDPLSAAAQTCLDRWNDIMIVLKSASDIDISFLETDPWGSPYLVDENEGEMVGDYCRRDTLFSAGLDQVHEAIDEDATGDGYSIRLNFYDTGQCGE